MQDTRKKILQGMFIVLVLVGLVLFASSYLKQLFNEMEENYEPIRYNETTKIIEVKPYDENTYIRIDVETGVTYIVTQVNGLFDSSETVVEKYNSDGSLYITPESEIKELIKKAEVAK